MDQRLKGQEVSIRIVNDNVVVGAIESIAAFNDSVLFEQKEAGYLGEVTNRFDEILNGYSGDFEFHCTKADWIEIVNSIEARARREAPNLTFNVVRVDLYPNGDSLTFNYIDVKWGAVPTNVSSRGDFVKVRMEFKCEQRTNDANALP